MVNEWKQIAYKKLDADADTITLGATTAKTANNSFDFSSATGWSQTGTDVDIDDVTNKRLDWSIPNSINQDDAVSYDIGVSNISDNAWMLRFKIDINSFSQNTTANAKKLMIGISDADHATTADANQTAIGMQFMTVDNGTNVIRSRDSENSTWLDGSGTNLAHTLTQEILWCEIKRISTTSYAVSLFSDSNYTDLIEVQHEIMNAITGLRYIKIQINTTGVAPDGTFTGWIDDLEFWNGTNTVVEGGFEPHDMMKLVMWKPTGSNVELFINEDYGGSVIRRTSTDGGTDSTGGSGNWINIGSDDEYIEYLFLDFPNQEKLYIGHTVDTNGLGSSNATGRREQVTKNENQSDRIISLTLKTSTGNYNGAIVTLYGANRPTITHANGNTLVEVQGDTI